MLLFSVLMLCCIFILYENINESDALIIYDPRYRYYNLVGDSYGSYYDQKRYEIQSDTQIAKKSSHNRKTKTQPSIDLSFEPLGALKIFSLVHGEIEINPDKIDDVMLNLATGTLSMIPEVYQYLPSLPSFFGEEESAERSSENRSSPLIKHHRTRPSDQDKSQEDDGTKEISEPKDDQSGTEDNSETLFENNSDKKSDKESSEDDDNAAEEHDDDSKQPPNDSEPKNNFNRNQLKSEEEKSSQEVSKEDKNSEKNSKEKEPELLSGIEIPIEVPPQEGYVDKFVKYYSYAKPLAKAASLFVPGIGQYRGVMLGIEMADLAYTVASMYSKGDGYLSMGYVLGKEAFKRLGRRNEPESKPFSMSQNSDTEVPSTDLNDFLENVKITQYPSLDDKKEQEIKTSVSNIIYKYCYDQEQYQNETERAKFIDFMISCVKFIALHEILFAATSNKSS